MAFHFWNTAAVVSDLAQGRITEADTAKYAVASGVLLSWIVYCATWIGGFRSWALIFEFCVVIAITAFGTYECFKANGGASGSHFLRNFWCVGWPVNLKVTLLGVAIGNAMYFGFPVWVGATFRNPAFVYTVVGFFVTTSLAMAFYWRVAVHLAALAVQTRSNSALDPDAGGTSPPAHVS